MKKILITAMACLWAAMAFANHWTPNDSFELNMTVTAIVQVNGTEQRVEDLELGVFCNEECRGSQLPTYIAALDRYVYFTQVYGLKNDSFTFKLYSQSSGEELALASPEAISFNEDGYGSLSNPYILDFTEIILENYTITVNIDPEEGGDVTGAGNYIEGQDCSIVATANEGFAFLNWTENGNVVSTSERYSFTVTSNRDLVAHFVSSDSPWLPNDDYELDMTLTAIVQINGVEQRSEDLELDVFCGEQCRGMQKATYIEALDRYVYFTQIYGILSDSFTFKLYDHGSDVVLDLVSPDAIAFDVDGCGTLSNPQVLNFTGAVFQIAAEVNPEVGGTVNGAGIYNQGDAAILTATPHEGYTFVNWTEEGEVVSTEADFTVAVMEPKSFVANFSLNAYHITANANLEAGGIVTGSGTYDHGAVVTLAATANEGYSFVNWTKNGVVVSTEERYTITVTESGDYIANFSRNSFEVAVSVNPTNGGTVAGAGTYFQGTMATLIATASEGYTFNNWTENGVVISTETIFSVIVNESVTYVANFTLNSYEVVVVSNVEAGGSVTGTGNYVHGASAVISADVNEGYTFVNWTKNDSVVSTNSSYTFVVTESATYVANFALNSYLITAVSDIEAGGAVIGAGTFDHGATALLKAVANEGYAFMNWTENGEVVSIAEHYSFEVTGNRDLVAHFVENDNHWLLNDNYEFDMTLTAVVHINDVEQRSEDLELGVFCGDECRGTQMPTYIEALDRYVYFTQVYGLQSDVFTFKLYDHGLGREPKVFSTETLVFDAYGYGSLASPQVLNFMGLIYQITVEANPVEGGVVTGSGIYELDEPVTLSATPNEGYAFVNWTESGEEVSTDPIYSFAASDTATYVANFSLNSYQVSAQVNPTEGGTVTGAGTYDHGATATLTALASEGYSFVNWTKDGVEVSVATEYSFVVTESVDLIANFAINTYVITIMPNSNEGGSVSFIYDEVDNFDFEDGSIPSNWDNSVSSYPWTIWSSNPHSGTYCISSNNNNIHSSQSYIEATVDFISNGSISFYSRISSESGYDYGRFYIDGTQMLSESGTNNTWTARQYDVAAGTHTFRWQYTKDGSVNNGEDRYYIDDIAFDGLSIESGSIALQHGETCTVYAIANDEYSFINWTENGEVVSADPTYSFIVTGDRVLTANFALPQDESVEIELTPGWNWISYLPTTEMTVEAAFANLSPNDGDMVKSQSAFSTYNASTGQWSGGLNTFSPGRGLIYLRNGEMTSFSYPSSRNNVATPDLERGDVVIELTPGWNWISYLPTTEMTVEAAFANLSPNDGDIVKSQAAFCTYNASTGQWSGGLKTFTPGRGLIYLRNGETTTFTYPK